MANIDTSIYGQIQPIQIESPINALMKAEQLRGSQNQNRLFDMQVSDRERAMAGENALNNAYRTATGTNGMIDRNQLYSSVASSGQGAKLPGIQKQFAEQDKLGLEATKVKLDNSLKTLDVVSQSLGPTLQNPALYQQTRAALMQQYPEGAANLPEQFDPAIIQSVINKALTAKDQITFKNKEIDQILERERFGESKRHNRVTEGISGGNLRVAQEGLGLRRQEMSQGAKAPAGYRFSADGKALEAIPGGPADIKAGEAGAKREKQIQGSIASAERVLGTVKDAVKRVGATTAGAGGSLLAKVPGTDARDLASDVDTIKANLGFDRLQQMRDESPTGGALGAIAVQELIALQSTVASLDTSQSPAQLKKNLQKIETHYTNWLDTIKGKKPSGVNEPKGQNVFDAADAIINGGR